LSSQTKSTVLNIQEHHIRRDTNSLENQNSKKIRQDRDKKHPIQSLLPRKFISSGHAAARVFVQGRRGPHQPGKRLDPSGVNSGWEELLIGEPCYHEIGECPKSGREIMPAILVVDDNPMAVDLVTEVLEPEGFEIIACSDPNHAVELAENADAIVLDVMMPGISGFEVLRMLREDPVLAEIPVLMLSALGEGDDRATGLERGADDYLGKPFHGKELVLRIRKLLEKRRDPGIILEGSLDSFTVGNILQQILESRRSGVLEIEGTPLFTADVFNGHIISAEFGSLEGREALLASIEIGKGRFTFREAEIENRTSGKGLGIHNIMMEAAWLQDELKKYNRDVPGSDEPLFFTTEGKSVELPRELEGLEVQEVADWLSANPGLKLPRLERDLPLAPLKTRLAIAWLHRAGFLSDKGFEGR